jgi:membrane fusion protein (multidrug efflux system)
MKTLINRLFVAAMLAASLILPGCDSGSAATIAAEPDATMDAVPVKVSMPLRSDIFATYESTTTIGSEGDAPVLAKVPGEVIELLVQEGDYVSKGDILARLDGDRLRLEMLAAKANLDKARAEYERYLDLHDRGLVSKSMFDGLKYELDALEASYDLRKLNYGYTNIRATISGYVSGRNIKPGQNIGLNHETFRITDTSELLAQLQIPQIDLRKFSVGHKATLKVDSIPGRSFDAEIIRISPTIDTSNGTFRATAFIDNSDGALAPGMFARFRIAYEMHPDVLVIPMAAVIEEDDATTVYVVVDGEVEQRAITTGIRSDDRIEVLQGLAEDEQVVVVGHSALRDGSKVLARLDNPERFTG